MPSNGQLPEFMGTLSIVSASGGTALVRPIRGFIGYSIENCVEGQCSFELESIEVFSIPISGTYTDASGIPYPYAANAVSMSIVSPTHGQYDESRGVISFSSNIGIILGVDMLTVDGVLIGSIENLYVSTPQIVGAVAGGTLTLNGFYQSQDITVYVTISAGT